MDSPQSHVPVAQSPGTDPDAARIVSDLPEVRLDSGSLLDMYVRVRSDSMKICAPLEVEDFVVQTMDDASPTKWHLAHTTWFFETMVLERAQSGFRPFHSQYRELFNSYYNSIGRQHARPLRGLLSRPTVEEIQVYREHVDSKMQELLSRSDRPDWVLPVVRLGLHHEQQHQELMLTDLKTVFGASPLRPAYRTDLRDSGPALEIPELRWIEFDESLHEVGFDGDGFCYDNEIPRHRTYGHAFALANRLVTCGEYLEFIASGGYQRPEFWLSEGWAAVNELEWTAPLYWEQVDGEWWQLTLRGLERIRSHDPVAHLSYVEADAFARWKECRLPTEFEWERAADGRTIQGNLRDSDRLHPAALGKDADPSEVHQLFGDVWEWTQSQYNAYPGYQSIEGPLGEYNAKFMCGQLVLRGGSCVTPDSHIRSSYRNFFYPRDRWQFSGLRLAKDLS